MAGKLVELKEAATMLGMTPDELSDLRSRGEIHGYRDGASWKFKVDEVERVADDLGVNLSRGSGVDLPSAAELTDDLDDIFAEEGDSVSGDADSILVSEEELGQSTGASTIIGKKSGESSADSDIQISEPDDAELGLAAAESDLGLAPDDASGGSAIGAKTSSVELDDAALGSDLDLMASDSGPSVGDDLGTKKSTGDLQSDTGSDLSLEANDDLELAMDSSLSLGTGSDDELGLSSGSEVELDVDHADALELGASGIGSDVTLGAADSGINLSPTDSGLSLDEPLDLGGSSVEQLELPEDDDIISLDEEIGDPDAATQLKADDEFLLTPVEDMPEDESSGSQVIALEDSDVYADADAQTMLGANQLQPFDQAAPLVAEDADMLGAGATGIGAGGATAQPMMQQVPVEQLPEAKYSIWNVLSLMLIVVILVLTGTFMYDVVKNLSEFETPNNTTVSLVDSVIKAVGLDKK
jgi:hypothetical protein